jgi:hypothetical protein
VWPVSFTSLSILGWRCYRQKKFLQTFPLLLTQFNSSLIWGNLAAFEVGYFYLKITQNQFMKGDMGGQRDLLITGYLEFMTFLAPLNLFLYSWRFWRELEQSVSNRVLKIISRGFEIFTIAVFPPAFYALIFAWIYTNQEYLYLTAHFELAKSNRVGNKNSALSKTMDIFGPIMNIMSCGILSLVVCLVFKLSR